jgi:nicotinamide mononucleotide transporter
MSTVTSKSGHIDIGWLILLSVVGGGLSVLMASSLFSLSVSLSGILCVGLTAVGRREGYLFGLYASVSYSVLAYNDGLFGEVYLNLLFFVPTGIIGYIMWNRHMTASKTVVMRQLGWPQRIVIAVVCVVFTVVLGLLLGLHPKQNTPFIDATTNVLSVVATFLMMWRYKEQWIFYIVLNIVSIVMWALRAVEGGDSGNLMVLMWTLFLLNAIFGFWRWHTGSKWDAGLNGYQATKEPQCDAA